MMTSADTVALLLAFELAQFLSGDSARVVTNNKGSNALTG